MADVKTDKHAKAVQADVNVRKHLALATDAKEAGKSAKAEEHERKARFWLDRWNRLLGNR